MCCRCCTHLDCNHWDQFCLQQVFVPKAWLCDWCDVWWWRQLADWRAWREVWAVCWGWQHCTWRNQRFGVQWWAAAVTISCLNCRSAANKTAVIHDLISDNNWCAVCYWKSFVLHHWRHGVMNFIAGWLKWQCVCKRKLTSLVGNIRISEVELFNVNNELLHFRKCNSVYCYALQSVSVNCGCGQSPSNTGITQV